MQLAGTNFVVSGFNDWSNCGKIIKFHENTPGHRVCVKSWLLRSEATGCVDAKLQENLKEERRYFQAVLRRVIEIIKFLAQRGLAFRGDDEVFGSSNNRNYMGILELIAKFDPFLADHISHYGNRGKGSVSSYLSSTICNEFI